MNDFQGIRIVELDVQRSHVADRALYDMYLRLSEEPQNAWDEAFEVYWRQTIYSMKRRAHVEGQYLVIRCVPEEIEKYHKPALQAAVNFANNAYREYIVRQEKAKAETQQRERQEAERLAELKGRLRFDS